MGDRADEQAVGAERRAWTRRLARASRRTGRETRSGRWRRGRSRRPVGAQILEVAGGVGVRARHRRPAARWPPTRRLSALGPTASAPRSARRLADGAVGAILRPARASSSMEATSSESRRGKGGHTRGASAPEPIARTRRASARHRLGPLARSTCRDATAARSRPRHGEASRRARRAAEPASPGRANSARKQLLDVLREHVDLEVHPPPAAAAAERRALERLGDERRRRSPRRRCARRSARRRRPRSSPLDDVAQQRGGRRRSSRRGRSRPRATPRSSRRRQRGPA